MHVVAHAWLPTVCDSLAYRVRDFVVLCFCERRYGSFVRECRRNSLAKGKYLHHVIIVVSMWVFLAFVYVVQLVIFRHFDLRTVYAVYQSRDTLSVSVLAAAAEILLPKSGSAADFTQHSFVGSHICSSFYSYLNNVFVCYCIMLLQLSHPK